MKKIALVLFLYSSCVMAQDVKMMTYNLRYNNPGDGENQWSLRKEYLKDQIRFYEPDILGIQEGVFEQVQYLDNQLDNYTYVGVGRDDGKTKGEFSALFFKKEWQVEEQNTFWLSETPDEVSVGWDASMERVCTFARLKRDDVILWVFNTHFDHIGTEARKNSVTLILEKIKHYAQDDLVILMGDLNLEPEAAPIQMLKSSLNDSHDIAEVRFGPTGTFNGFDFSKPVTRRIDYIFTHKNLTVKKFGILSDSKDMKYPSDHLPVIITIDAAAMK